MERFDITIRMYSADASGTQYVWDKVPAEEGDFVLYTDAQATIATLHARVRELEQWVQDQSTANLEKMQHMDEMQSRALEAESQLAQRTAELEAAKHCYADLLAKYQNLVAWYDKQNGTPCEQVRHKQEVADLQAELERARG